MSVIKSKEKKTDQLNFRVSPKTKKDAIKKADEMWVKLNTVLNIFLEKFINEKDIIKIKQDIDMEKVFDEWVISYFKSEKWKSNIKETEEIIDNIL